MSKKILRPPVKIHGGKWFLKKWILEHFPKDIADMKYCEPFCGGSSVFLNKEPSEDEAIADIDKGIIAIFKALRDEPTEFISRIKRCKYQETTFKKAQKRVAKGFDDYIDQAVSEYIIRRMSRGGLKQAFAWSDRLRGGKPGDVNAWETMIEQLPVISERLSGVSILNESFESVFKVWDEEDALTYLDPPYLPVTRSDGSQNVYEYELTVDDHVNLLNMVKNARGKVILSGYSSPLYRTHLKEWRCKKRDIANHSGQGKNKQRRTECLWMNY